MKKLYWSIVILVAIAVLPVHASGYGWYVRSFDWERYQEAARGFDKTAKKLAAEDRFKNTIDMHKDDAFDNLMYDAYQTYSILKMREESPERDEYYWPDALRYAAELQKKKGIKKTYFSLFASGRPMWTWPDCCDCSDYYCPGAYFVLSPHEVKAFAAEVTALNANVVHPDDYRAYLLHLQGVLLKAMADYDRGLYFEGHS